MPWPKLQSRKKKNELTGNIATINSNTNSESTIKGDACAMIKKILEFKTGTIFFYVY